MKKRVSSLKHHPLNREIYSLSSIEDLMASIEEVGLLQNIVIDQHDQVVSGNRRLEAIRNLGWKSVKCERVKIDPHECPSSYKLEQSTA